jgi:hypothetical protein
MDFHERPDLYRASPPLHRLTLSEESSGARKGYAGPSKGAAPGNNNQMYRL